MANVKNAFTPKSVLTLLRTVLKGNDRLPPQDGELIAMLTKALNILHWRVKGWAGPWSEHLETVRRIGEAILILTETLPTLREDYVREIKLLERHDLATEPPNRPAADSAKARACIAEFIEKQRARLAAFDALVSAADDARELGLPMVNNPMLVTSPRTEHWMDYAETLAAIFRSALPGRSKEAAFRFVEAVSPTISGENPTFEAVRSAFMRKRFVDSPFAQLKFGENFPVKTALKKKRLVNRGKCSD